MKNKIRRLTLTACFVIFCILPVFSAKAECPKTGKPDIHLMFVYTPKVLHSFGGNLDALEGDFELAVAEINYVWEQSGLDAHALLVRVMPITYTELRSTDNIDSMLDAIIAILPEGSVARQNFIDRYGVVGNYPLTEIPEDVSAAADLVGADGVILVHGGTVEEVGGTLGVGNIKVPEDDGLGADACRVAILIEALHTNSYVMAHEFGHASGCSHDRWTNQGPSFGYHDYSTGYIAPPTNPPFEEVVGGLGTVMSYVHQMENGTVFPYFSDPQKIEQEWNMGTEMDDNVRTLEQTLSLVADHRDNLYTLKPATIDFSTTDGATSATFSVDFRITNSLPNNGSIVIEFPGGFKFSEPETTTATQVVGMDGTLLISASGQTLTIKRNSDGTPVPDGTRITFDLNFIGTPETEVTVYTGNFCMHTYDGSGTEIDHNHAVYGDYVTYGLYPLPTYPRPPRYRDSSNAMDRLGCLVSDFDFSIFTSALAALGLLVITMRLCLKRG